MNGQRRIARLLLLRDHPPATMRQRRPGTGASWHRTDGQQRVEGMAKGPGKDARHKAHAAGSKLKSLRRELADLAADLERARAKRDKAQARLEALEAIAEQLTSAVAAAEADERARQTAADDGVEVDLTAPADAATPEAAPSGKRARRSGARAEELDEGTESIDLD